MNKYDHIELIHHMIYIIITNSSDKLQSCRVAHVVIVLNMENTSRRRDYNIGYYHEPVIQGVDYSEPILENNDLGW